MAHFVESEFEHCGYKCVVVFQPMGHRCGYVGIPKTHTLYGDDYCNYLDIKKEDLEDKKVSGVFPLFLSCFDEDERIRIDAFFECHGGITYSGGGENSNYPINSDLWWFGFDCAHYMDGRDLYYALEKFPEEKELIEKRIEWELECPLGGTVRTKEYVEKECMNLAEQLKVFEKQEEEDE